jgi:glycosyltransferase involved in cell wall biosynthesis
VGDGADRRRLEDAARRDGLDNVVFTGLIPKHEVMDVIAASDACLVHLKGTELFGSVIPSKIFETMALGVPIVMGVRGQSLQIVLDAEAGVPMTPDDPGSLLDGIDAIRLAPDRFGDGRDYVAKHFNRDDLAGLMLEVLKDAGGRSAAAQRDRFRPTLHEIQSRAA